MRALSRYYTCTADTSHATIYRSDVEGEVKLRLAAEFLNEEREPVNAPAPLARRLAELEEERTRWTAVAALPGADLASVTRELARIAAEAEKVGRDLGRSRVSSLEVELAERAPATLATLSSVGPNMWEWDTDKWDEFFDALDIEERRTLGSRLRIIVSKGRGMERVSITRR